MIYSPTIRFGGKIVKVNVLFCGMDLWAAGAQSSVNEAKCDAEITAISTIDEAARLLADTEIECRLDIVVVAVIDAMDIVQAVDLIKKLRAEHDRVIVIGVGLPVQYASLQKAGCHEVFLSGEIAVVTTCIKMFVRGARALNPV